MRTYIRDMAIGNMVRYENFAGRGSLAERHVGELQWLYPEHEGQNAFNWTVPDFQTGNTALALARQPVRPMKLASLEMLVPAQQLDRFRTVTTEEPGNPRPNEQYEGNPRIRWQEIRQPQFDFVDPSRTVHTWNTNPGTVVTPPRVMRLEDFMQETEPKVQPQAAVKKVQAPKRRPWALRVLFGDPQSKPEVVKPGWAAEAHVEILVKGTLCDVDAAHRFASHHANCGKKLKKPQGGRAKNVHGNPTTAKQSRGEAEEAYPYRDLEDAQAAVVKLNTEYTDHAVWRGIPFINRRQLPVARIVPAAEVKKRGLDKRHQQNEELIHGADNRGIVRKILGI